MVWCEGYMQASTYSYYAANEQGVHEEVARLREAARLALDRAAVLV